MIPFTRRLPWPVEFEGEFANALERLFNPEEGFNAIEKFAPMCNLAETEAHYEVTVELPGMKPEEFNVELRNGELWITGERKEEKEEKGKTWHRMERRYGEFRRVFRLPLAVEEEKVTAEYKEGILRVTVPKVAEAKPKRVEVKA
jgi:HSP20 family protein